MRWSESVTIYLAVGASFGVSRYLCAAGRAGNLVRAILEGIVAALLWPLAGAAILTTRLRHVNVDDAEEREARLQRRIEEARRAFVVAVNKMLYAARRSPLLKREALERTLYALREGVEQYVGLASVEAEVDRMAAPAKHEMELARISGRSGDDLLLAGRCAHRRNVSRIKTHYERERARLLQKLAELRTVEGDALSYQDDDEAASCEAMSGSRLEVYLRATDLFSLLEDERAARIAARLTDAECLTLRRMKAATPEAEDSREDGEERCTENATTLIYKDPLRATTFTQG